MQGTYRFRVPQAISENSLKLKEKDQIAGLLQYVDKVLVFWGFVFSIVYRTSFQKKKNNHKSKGSQPSRLGLFDSIDRRQFYLIYSLLTKSRITMELE
ncbi:hypothetical protein J2Z65_004622 [Paenibacillus aceris]|uniref:Uncharacterized protein n=1 Tax=Paenibacillus aceris TaxID=869555 RepID=A0ABS4I3K1_9BACL|nr:hypothetical protein [Paenibacillus aceris]